MRVSISGRDQYKYITFFTMMHLLAAGDTINVLCSLVSGNNLL